MCVYACIYICVYIHINSSLKVIIGKYFLVLDTKTELYYWYLQVRKNVIKLQGLLTLWKTSQLRSLKILIIQ